MQTQILQVYCTDLQKMALKYPALKNKMTLDLVAKIDPIEYDQVLREDFFHNLSLFSHKPKAGQRSPNDIMIGEEVLQFDKQSLEFIIGQCHSWANAYPKMKVAKSGQQLKDIYMPMAASMGSFKMNGEDEIPYGPSWASFAEKLDHGEEKRRETAEKLGLGK